MGIKFNCDKCDKKQELRKMWIISKPNVHPQKLCCRNCFNKALEKF